MARDVKDSKEDFNECLDAMHEQRSQVAEDLRFSDPSDPDQWDPEIKRRRENDPGGKRLCLVHDQTSQYVSNVSGQIEKSPPALHAVPVGGGADKRTAELIDGRFRHIENASTASQHYATALTNAARVGVGYLTCRPAKVNEKMRFMEPRIGSVPNSLNVVFDPWSTELDGKDATKAWELIPVSQSSFRQRWPGHELSDFDSVDSFDQSDVRKSVIVAQEWLKTVTRTKGVCYLSPENEEVYATKDEYDAACLEAGAAYPILHEFKMDKIRVMWRLLSGLDVLQSSEYECDHIGLVPIYGYVGHKDNRLTYCGIPRRARAPQQSYNYHISELQAYMATAPRSPWLVAVRSLMSKGTKAIWDKANVEQRAYLPYDDMDQNGQPVTAPTRAQVSVSLQNHEEGANRALRDLQASIGMYQANIGAKSNVISGVAYEAQKEQGEASTAHFPSHLAASLGHLGRIVMQMDIRLHDTRRESPIINYDQSPGTVTIDPEAPTPYTKDEGVLTINPTTGTYSVRVVVGASYITQRAQTNVALNEIMRSNKELAPIIAPEWARTLDLPGSERLANALLAMAPPAVQAAMKPEGMEGEPDAAALVAENTKLKEALQEATGLAQDAEEEIDKYEDELRDAKAALAAKKAELRIQAFEANTNRLKVIGANEEQARAIAADTVAEALAHNATVDTEAAAEPIAEEAAMPEQEVEREPDTRVDEVLQGQQEIKEALMMLIDLTQRKRIRVPERDKSGLITRVIDQLDEPTEQTLQ